MSNGSSPGTRGLRSCTLRRRLEAFVEEAALELGFLTEQEFDAWVVPADMTHPSAADE
ncbi:MAG: hypothetical protein ACFNYZ_05515 [Pauljensenia sp.]